MRFDAPAASLSVGAVAGAAVACYPGMLPRSALVSGVVVAVGVAAGTLVGAWWARRRGPGDAVTRRRALVCGAVVFASLIAASAWWQRALRTALDADDVGPGWVAATALPAMSVWAALVWRPRAVGWAMVASACVTAGYLAPGTAGASTVDYFGSLAAGDVQQRARDVVSAWVADGGLTRSAVIVAVPTGSGWIDAAAVDGLHRRFGPDVPMVGVQYADVSSWRAFIGDRGAAGRSAIAVVSELDRTIRRSPHRPRPRVVLYGQSLGAVGADTARLWALTHGVPIAATIEVGVPADAVPARAADRTVIGNPSDPVTHWSPSLLWRPAQMPDEMRRVGRAVPHPPWVPVISFLQTSVDLLGALDVPTGGGHRYGVEQAGG